MEGHPVAEVEDEIFRYDPDSDIINARRKFIWFKPVAFPLITPDIYGQVADKPFQMVRIWFFVYNSNKKVFMLWCRSSRVSIDVDFKGGESVANKIYKKVRRELAKKDSYKELKELVAWTLYRVGETASRTGLKGRASIAELKAMGVLKRKRRKWGRRK